MKAKIKEFIEHSVPPGANTAIIPRFMIIGYIISVLFSFSFWHRYFDKYWELFITENKVTVLSGVMMTDFSELYDGSMLAFAMFMLYSLVFAVHYYGYYRQGSKSIYLMKRLPSRLERHRRALTLPILMCVAFLVLAVITTLVYFGLYMLITPNECILPTQWQKLWGYLL